MVKILWVVFYLTGNLSALLTLIYSVVNGNVLGIVVMSLMYMATLLTVVVNGAELYQYLNQGEKK